MKRLVPAVAAMLLCGCHWIAPLSPGPAAGDAEASDHGAPGMDLDAGLSDPGVPIDTTAADLGPAADTSGPADVSGPTDDGVIPVDLGCPVSPGVCGTPSD